MKKMYSPGASAEIIVQRINTLIHSRAPQPLTKEMIRVGFGGDRFLRRETQDVDFENGYKVLLESGVISFLGDNVLFNSAVKEAAKEMTTKKVFISHAESDKELVDAIIELLDYVGLEDRIFCTSDATYGIDLAENYLETIRVELNNSDLVLFLLTDNFYKSKFCLCEMGATWVLQKRHIPILHPNVLFSKVGPVIPLTQGIKLNNSEDITKLYKALSKHFSLPTIEIEKWEKRKRKYLTTVDKLLSC